MVTSKLWIIKNVPNGFPKEEHFQIIEENLRCCKENDIIVEATYISIDPYIRCMIGQADENSIVTGYQIAKVIESLNADFPVGSYMTANLGWRTHAYVTGEDLKRNDSLSFAKLPELGNHPKSTALGVLGGVGVTAYFGFLEVCKPKHGDTVLVNAAAGAVGSLVCQIAKIKGCKVIAFAGSDAKVEWLKDLGVDYAFNYKTANISQALKEAAPNGINCYFDNVGGTFSARVFPFMAEFGRVAVCGCISLYNQEDLGESEQLTPTGAFSEPIILWKQLNVEGFLTPRWLGDRWMEAVQQMKVWLDEGKLKYRETVTQGFENVPKAFIGLFSGDNTGKAIVQI